ncbi:MAG: NADH:ubiquinone reductase (Na(+)-transporting) subunit C [Flavobacteriales bacterium CG_4_9_14_3_um_filter_40_17]|nr:MAG: NADH:ubiquinone reductase (Na(+)-transporting) subunit C [Flavobacteriales bacterium CG_4_9_14_3_um_filter_40_17]
MDTNSNKYTFIFSIIMVVVIGVLLAFAAVSTKGRIDKNVRLEKMQNILLTVDVQTDREGAEKLYNQIIKEQLSLKEDGTVDESVDAFNINLAQELKKPVNIQRFPLYIAENEGQKYYIIPLRGAGLWDAIWGYISIEEDLNTVKGAVFDHKGETPGLGGEITTEWFQQQFQNEKIYNANGELTGVQVVKGNNDLAGTRKDDNAVDAISGATITSKGVSNMLAERLSRYSLYFKNIKSNLAIQKP